jgi:hypothetical protein
LAELHVDLLEKGSLGKSSASTPWIIIKKIWIEMISEQPA